MSSALLHSRLAGPQDFDLLLGMVRDFYVEDEIAYEPQRVEPGLRTLLAEPTHGAVLMLVGDDLPVAGYITLGWCFSVEQGGRFVLLDELYLVPAARGRGWGKQALVLARQWAQEQGASVLRLEVNHHNTRAKALYLASGFHDDSRDILTMPLAGPMPGVHP